MNNLREALRELAEFRRQWREKHGTVPHFERPHAKKAAKKAGKQK